MPGAPRFSPYKVGNPSPREIPERRRRWPHALPRSSSLDQAPMDHPRISGHDKAFRIDHKSFSTQYLNFQRGFYSLYSCVPMPGASPESNRFLHRADWAWDFFLPHTKKCSWNECICRKGVFISNNWHFVMTVALAKSSWPSLIFIENFIEWFFCFWFVFHSLSCAYTLVKHQAQRGHNPTWGFYMWRSVTLIVVHIKCVSLSGTEIAALLLSSRRSD